MWVAAGRIVLDFYNNDSARVKNREIEKLCKELRRRFNLSALEVADFEDPERCVMGLSAVLPQSWPEARARSFIQKVQKKLDEIAFARVQVEDWELFSHGD